VLEKGGSGVFDVTVDGALLFSKHKEGRFPTEEEVLAKLPG
jgi:selT/selW/selH-like putative selenoprotein